MTVPAKTFDELKAFLRFDEADAAHLRSLAPIFAQHGAGITDRFYLLLGEFPETAGLIEGRVDQLKQTHARWMGELFAGDYGEAYFENRLRIGLAHARIGLSPHYVEAVMSFLRGAALEAITAERGVTAEALAAYRSLVKILDLDLAVIGQAYNQERLERLSRFTGMSTRLLENCIRKAR